MGLTILSAPWVADPFHVLRQPQGYYFSVKPMGFTNNFNSIYPMGLISSSVTQAKLKVGEVTAAHNEKGIVSLKWKDKREVMVLSTKHDSSMTDSGKYNRK
jgi:hypothetical protein